MMTVIGSYSFQGNPYDVVIMLFFGFVGFGIRTLKSPLAIGLFLAGVILTYLSIRLQVMEKISSSASEMGEEQTSSEMDEGQASS